MSKERQRDGIIAIGTAVLLLVGVWTWQWHVGLDLPPLRIAEWWNDAVGKRPAVPVPIPPAPAIRARPSGNPGSWVSDHDYPPEAQWRQWTGTTAFTLIIGRDGGVETCVIRTSSGHDMLDEATCAVLTRRARFFARQGQFRRGGSRFL